MAYTQCNHWALTKILNEYSDDKLRIVWDKIIRDYPYAGLNKAIDVGATTVNDYLKHTYDANGFNYFGYDKNGYDKNGYDRHGRPSYEKACAEESEQYSRSRNQLEKGKIIHHIRYGDCLITEVTDKYVTVSVSNTGETKKFPNDSNIVSFFKL